MKIVSIFVYRLFAFQYDGEGLNEYDRLMDLWGDVAYIYEFLQQNIRDIPKGSSLESMVMTIMEDANQIDDILWCESVVATKGESA